MQNDTPVPKQNSPESANSDPRSSGETSKFGEIRPTVPTNAERISRQAMPGNHEMFVIHPASADGNSFSQIIILNLNLKMMRNFVFVKL